MPVWSCESQHTTGDFAEPDECPLLARTLPIATTQMRTFMPAGDHDWIRLTTAPNRLFAINVTASVALSVEIFEPDGLTLVASDRRGLPAIEFGFASRWTEVFARVRPLGSSDTGTYRVSYDDIGTDDFANDSADASSIQIGSAFTGLIQYAGDRDVVNLRVPARTAVRLQVPPGASALRFDAETSDAALRGLRGGDSAIVSFPTATTLALIASTADRTPAPFTITTSSLGQDDHSDAREFATPLITDGVPLTAEINRTNDVDSFLIPQIAGHVYRANWSMGFTSSFSTLGYPLTDGPLLWEAPDSRPLFVSISGPTGPCELAVLDNGVDDYGDTESSATSITLGQTVNGRLETPTDVDVFTFNAIAGHSLNLTVSPSIGKILGPNGDQITTAGSAGLATATGPHRLVIANFPILDVVSYTATVRDLGVDDFGDTEATATVVPANLPIIATSQFPGDVDAFLVQLLADHRYSFSFAGTGSMDVRRAGSLQPVVGPNANTNPLVFVSSGGQFLVVGAGQSGTAFTITITDLGPEDHGSTVATATPIVVGTPVPGELLSLDTDYFSFGSIAGHGYGITMPPNMGLAEFNVRTANGTLLASTWGGATSFASAGGTLWIDATAPYVALGPYTLTVDDRGPDDFGNDESSASHANLGAVLSGRLQYASDVDVFEFAVVPGNHYGTTTTCGGCGLSLRTQTGVMVGTDFRATSGTTSIFVSVRGADNLTYQLTMNDYGPDDHGNGAADATNLPAGEGSLSGNLEVASDVDAFRVSVPPGVTLHVSSANVALSVMSNNSIIRRITTTGALEIDVQIPGNAAYLFVSPASPAPVAFTIAAYVANDDITTVMPLTRGTTRQGRIDYLGDTDTFTYDVASPGLVDITISGARIEVRDPQGQLVGVADNTTLTLNTTLTGTWRIRVAAGNSTPAGIGPFSILVP
ncbi:MAG: hypothetical protein QM817_03420 [Archangium sp.]